MLGIINEAELNARFDSIAFRVERDVLDLLPSRHITQHVTLDAATRSHYVAMRDNFITIVNGDAAASAPIALTQLLRMQQITSGYITTEPPRDKGSTLLSTP